MHIRKTIDYNSCRGRGKYPVSRLRSVASATTLLDNRIRTTTHLWIEIDQGRTFFAIGLRRNNHRNYKYGNGDGHYNEKLLNVDILEFNTD